MSLERLRKYWPLAVIGFMPFIGLLTVINLCLELDKPYGGFLAIWYPPRLAWSLHPTTPQWWSTVETSELRYDDTLVSTNGDDGPGSFATYARAARDGHSSVQLEVLRGGARTSVTVPIRRFSLNDLLEVKLPDAICGLCYWLAALAVFLNRPEGAVQRAFGVASGLFAGFAWLTVYSLGLEPRGALAHLCDYLYDASTAFLGIALLHQTLVFPSKVERVPRRLLLVLYSGIAVAGAFGNAAHLSLWYTGVFRVDCEIVAMVIMATVVGICLAGFIGRPLWLVTQSRTPRRVQKQAWVLLAGVGVAAPFMAIDLVRRFDARGYFWLAVDSRWALMPLVISLAAVIVRYHGFTKLPSAILLALMIASSAAIANVGASILRLANPRAAREIGALLYCGFTATALFASAIWRLQTSWRGGFARLLHWDRVSYSAVRKFGQDVVRQGSFDSRLPETIAKALVTQLGLERAAVWLWDEGQNALTLAASIGSWPQPAPHILSHQSLRADNGGPPNRLDQKRSERLSQARSLLPMVEVLEPMWISGKLVGALGLGKRWEDEIFDERDLEIVDLVTQQASLFLLTATQVEQLRQVPGQIAAIQERERFKIAQELHDTIQQFLGRLPFLLEVSRQAVLEDPEEAQAMLENCITEVGQAAVTVRELQSNLAPRQLEKGLLRPLSLLVDKFRARTGIAAETCISPGVDRSLSLEARHALYRVVQQALDNIAAHAQATYVNLRITADVTRIGFTIADNGRGFSEEDRSRAEEQGSFGLKSMAARIVSLQGELVVDGASSVGACVSGWLPNVPSSGSEVNGETRSGC